MNMWKLAEREIGLSTNESHRWPRQVYIAEAKTGQYFLFRTEPVAWWHKQRSALTFISKSWNLQDLLHSHPDAIQIRE